MTQNGTAPTPTPAPAPAPQPPVSIEAMLQERLAQRKTLDTELNEMQIGFNFQVGTNRGKYEQNEAMIAWLEQMLEQETTTAQDVLPVQDNQFANNTDTPGWSHRQEGDA